MSEPKNHETHVGHRQRLIDKLKNEELSDIERLEILLFNAVPRRNTNDLAHRLLSHFDGLTDMFTASMKELSSIEGVGENVAAYLRCIGSFFYDYPVFRKTGDWQEKVTREDIIDRLNAHPVDATYETAELYLLDEEGYITSRHALRGSSCSVNINVEWLSQILIDYAPAGIFVVHNHPGGTPEPSPGDENMTRQCQILCSMHNVVFCDHIIHTNKGVAYSYYDRGEMTEISEMYAVGTIMKKGMAYEERKRARREKERQKRLEAKEAAQKAAETIKDETTKDKNPLL